MYKLLLLAFAASASALSFQGGCAPVIASRASAVGALFVAEPSCVRRAGVVEMAVPKKRQSKMKTRQRKANWFAKTKRQATLALSRAKSVGYDPLEDPKYSFDDVDEDDEDEDEEDDE